MTAKTRLGYEGYGVERAGSFLGKTPSGGSHPVGIITRLSLDGYGVRRYGSFGGKTASGGGGGAHPVTIITRLSLDGYGVRRYGSFSGKTPSGGGGGTHPVTIITRLSLDGYGVRRYGSFAGKTAGGAGGGTHPVGIITRLSLDGYGVRRYNSFAGKTSDDTVVFAGKYWGPKREVPKVLPVDSSTIEEVSFDKASNELNIKFRSGRVYNYSNIDNKKVKGLLRAKSSGKYLHNNIKGKYFTTRMK